MSQKAFSRSRSSKEYGLGEVTALGFPQGFQVLVEMEWLDFGHKFADRCGHGENSDDLNERCPVFLQWLDCVHQLQRQFPCSFEFNEAFLVSDCFSQSTV